MSFRLLWLLAALFLALGSPRLAAAQLVDLVWTSATEASGGGISATASHGVTAGSVSEDVLNATNPTFVSEFGSAYSLLNLLAPASVPADIDSTITFSPALPAGARLVVVDVDFEGEAVSLSSGGVPLTLLTQLESILGANSVLPGWAPPTLVASGPPLTNNDLEASVFDLSGIATLDVAFDQGLGSGVGIAVFVPPPPVPVAEIPARIVLIATLLALGTALWPRRDAIA